MVAGLGLLGYVRNSGRISRGNECPKTGPERFLFSRNYFRLREYTEFADPTCFIMVWSNLLQSKVKNHAKIAS